MDLFEAGQDDTLGAPSLKVNEQFAEKYEAKKRREELSKLKDKYGQEGENSEDETDYSSEDSDAEFVTPQVDAAILKIISRIQSKDSSLYDSDGNLFQAEEAKLGQALKAVNAERKKRNEKPMKLKDYQRRALLASAKNGFASDEEEGGESGLSTRTPAQEEEALRRETKAAFLNAVNGDDLSDQEDDLLVRRDEAESDDDEDQYKRFLLENVGEKELNKILAMRPETKSDGIAPISDQKAEDDFLKNFILNRGWLDKKSNHLPSYKEIVMDDDEGPAPGPTASGSNAIMLDHEGSDEELEKAEEFEKRYNFRFEEASGGEIQTHARDVGTSMRREDTSRKQAREAAAARKAEEKAERMRDLERLNSLKKQEILDKIAQIKKVAGASEGIDLTALDLETEYDPETHDSKMQRVFNDLFYQDTGVDADGKPVWDDDIDISDIVPTEDYAPGGEAYDPTEAGASGKKTRADRKKEKKQKKRDKGKGKAEQEDEDEEPALDAEELEAIADPEERRRRIEQYMEEYYKLGHEDMIGDLPTRFHYTTKALNPRGISQDGEGLTPVEILMATDAELNAYESLKKLAPYRRPDEKERRNRKRMKELKKAVARRKWGEELPAEDEQHTFKDYSSNKRPHDDAADVEQPKAKEKRLGKKQRQRLKAREADAGANDGQA